MEDRIIETISITKMMYGWSKYGGKNYGVVKHNGGWFCQTCGAEQPKSVPSYMFCTDNGGFREFVRLCSCCENLVKEKKIKNYQELKEIVRKREVWEVNYTCKPLLKKIRIKIWQKKKTKKKK